MPEKTPSLETLGLQLDNVSSDVSEIKTQIKELTAVLGKVVVMEERQAHTNGSLERAFKSLEKIDARVTVLEQQAPLNKQASGWIEKALLGAFGMTVIALLAKIGH